MPEPDLEDVIRENAAGPASASGDSGSMQQHNLKDQIEADKYLAAKAAVQTPSRGIRFSRVIPPGPV